MTTGDVIGLYEIRAPLGEGAMAEVWEVFNQRLQRTEAMKVIKPQLRGDREFVSRFLNEATRTANLHHPNIAVVYSSSGPEEPVPYFTMELLRGENLASYAARHAPLDPGVVRELLLPVAKALDYAHFQGVIHRDIKPANIHIDTNGHVRVLDFGIARAVSAETNMTVAGQVLGTPTYMSPEQAGTPHAVGYESDQYSLAMVAYELLTSRFAFNISDPGSFTQVLGAHASAPPVDPTAYGVPASISKALLKALSKNPQERFPDCRSFLAAWDTPVVKDPPLPPPPPEHRSRKFPLVGMLALTGMLAGVGLIGRSMLTSQPEQNPTPYTGSGSTPDIDSTPEPPVNSTDAPEQVVRSYVTALKNREAQTAYGMRSAAYRAGTSLSKFTEHISGDYGNFKSNGVEINGDRATVPIRFDTHEKGKLTTWAGPVKLIQEDGEWKIHEWNMEDVSPSPSPDIDGPITTPSTIQSTPQPPPTASEPGAIIREYFGAINRRDTSAYDHYYSSGFQSKMSKSKWIREQLGTTSDIVIDRMESPNYQGNWAFVPMTWTSTEPTGRQQWTRNVSLHLERGSWKIHSFNGKTD